MIELENAVVYHGSNLDVLPTLPDNSVDSIVTDPPYELGFMGKSWDSSGIAYSVELWQECMRVLKPGGHLLAFGGSRTWHRLAVAIEDAGFEMRDSIAWLYGSGFPKSLDVSKAIDKAAGVERKRVELLSPALNSGTANGWGKDGHSETAPLAGTRQVDDPITPEAQKWQGWGTALKPAFEPVVVARKPLIGTVAQNVLTYGTGGLNIDASRIDYQDEKDGGDWERFKGHQSSKTIRARLDGNEGADLDERVDNGKQSGRWPANIILDPYTAELLDEQSGILKSGALKAGRPVAHTNVDFRQGLDVCHYQSEANSGGASRFFYVAKASKRDRNEGLEGLELRAMKVSVPAPTNAGVYGSTADGKQLSSPSQNFHPTVKPTSLMEYLIKLVTPDGGTVLDPFTGSGSTGKAALLNGFRFIGIELTEEYLPIIEGRLRWANEQRNQEASQSDKEEKETLF